VDSANGLAALYSGRTRGSKDGGVEREQTLGQSYFDANRANWDERADIHFRNETGFYGIDAVIAGRPVLTSIEKSELPPLAGKRVAHFQCHIGTDTLSLKLMGAASVTGLDFSTRALEHARRLAERAGLDATFVEGSVYDAPARIGTGYDLVFTSWGTICWLDDVEAWARAVAAVLSPGGQFYFADSHPISHLFEDAPGGGLGLHFDYETPRERPISADVDVTYTGSTEKLRSIRTYEWQHSFGQVLNALIGAGLTIDFVHEHDAIPWMMFSSMVPADEPGMFRLPAGQLRVPLAWSILAHRP
jgi:SAM-dependent methyltransferase